MSENLIKDPTNKCTPYKNISVPKRFLSAVIITLARSFGKIIVVTLSLSCEIKLVLAYYSIIIVHMYTLMRLIPDILQCLQRKN